MVQVSRYHLLEMKDYYYLNKFYRESKIMSGVSSTPVALEDENHSVVQFDICDRQVRHLDSVWG